MKTLMAFDSQSDLIFLAMTIYGPNGSTDARVILDTGATLTMVRSGVLEAVGYDLQNLRANTTIVTGSGVEIVAELQIQKIQALDHEIENMVVLCHDLPEESGLDGLLGLNFLRRFDIAIKYSDSTLTLTSHSV